MPSPGPPGEPFRVVAMSPLTPLTHRIPINTDEVVAAAETSGRIGPAGRNYWLRELRAGGRKGADAFMAMLEMPTGGERDEAAYQALYPDDPPPRPAAEPDRLRQADARLGWLQHNAAGYPPHPGRAPTHVQVIDRAAGALPPDAEDLAEPAEHGAPDAEDQAEGPEHDPMMTEHSHPHADYAGNLHDHTHAHVNDASHKPQPVVHLHQLAASNPVTAGIRARAAATAAPGLSDDQIYTRLYGPG